MGGGNGQKSATKRERNAKNTGKEAKSQLASNAKAMNLACGVCRQTFMCTAKPQQLKEHAENKHPKSTLTDCFPDLS